MKRWQARLLCVVTMALGVGVGIAIDRLRILESPRLMFDFRTQMDMVIQAMTWWDIAGLMLITGLATFGVGALAISFGVALAAKIIIRMRSWFEAHTAEMQAQRPPVVRVERRQA